MQDFQLQRTPIKSNERRCTAFNFITRRSVTFSLAQTYALSVHNGLVSARAEEQVVIISGQLSVKLPGQGWELVQKGESYVVPRNTSFEVEADSDAAYICYYK